MDRSYSSIRHHHHRHRRDNPSFSSSLLDSIYRSIDGEEDEATAERELIYYRDQTTRKNPLHADDDDDDAASFRRARMIEKWMMEKKAAAVRRSSAADFDSRPSRIGRGGGVALMNSSSTSSESSSGGGFSSSESERPANRRPKPIRTSLSAPPPENHRLPIGSAPNKRESGFVKTKSRALKIYGDLKKVKQPISPGGKLASFLNSIFNHNAAAKKPKPNSSPSASAAATATACSSASSFSRSCLSNTPSSRGKLSEGSEKRSVRFCPVSVIVDEDCRTVGHKSLRDPSSLMAVLDDRRRVQEVAIDLLKSYQRKSTATAANDILGSVVDDFDMRDVVRVRKNDANGFENDNEDDDDDDDAASYSSSDLFELDSLSAIGVERYREELPVYETTHFETNRAIANGYIL